MLILYIYQGIQLNENIKKSGYSILNSLITDTRHSIQKGERNTFQDVLEKISTLENVKSVALYTTDHLMTYKANEMTVGLPFLKIDNELINPNIELYVQTNGSYRRDDWSFSHNSMENHDQLIKKFKNFENISPTQCSQCHFVLDKNLVFDANRKTHTLEKEQSHFYYNIPVERNCISCHSHWKMGESAGYLSVSMDNTQNVSQSNDRLKYFFIILLVVIISFLTIGYFVKELNKKLQLTQLKLEDQANHDSMTHLYNRRSFYEIAKNILQLSQRNFEDLYIIMFDIDNFKKINDTYGHDVGDKVIITLSETLLKCIRKSDISARWGGEEFLVLLPKTNEKGALITAEKIRSTIESLVVKDVHFTVSVGVASFDHTQDSHIDDAIKKADEALYEAKGSGKNKVCMHI